MNRLIGQVIPRRSAYNLSFKPTPDYNVRSVADPILTGMGMGVGFGASLIIGVGAIALLGNGEASFVVGVKEEKKQE